MTFTPGDIAGPDGNQHKHDSEKTLEIRFGARARRILGMVALLVLVAWLASGGGQGSELSAGRANNVQSLAAEQPPVLDGRGKWTGYLPY